MTSIRCFGEYQRANVARVSGRRRWGGRGELHEQGMSTIMHSRYLLYLPATVDCQTHAASTEARSVFEILAMLTVKREGEKESEN